MHTKNGEKAQKITMEGKKYSHEKMQKALLFLKAESGTHGYFIAHLTFLHNKSAIQLSKYVPSYITEA